MVRRRTDQPPLSSCFVSVLEPYGERRKVRLVERLDTGEKSREHPSEDSIALVCHLEDGRVQVYAETGKDVPDLTLDNGLHFQGKAAWVSSRDGNPQHLVLCGGDLLRYGGWTLRLKQSADIFEVEVAEGSAKIVTGNPEWVDRLQRD
jgi:hypothetical protein